MFLTALAIAPGLAICFYFFYKDAHNPEPARYLVTSFVLGLLAVLPAAVIELGIFQPMPHSVPGTLFTAYFVVALVEEGCKFLVLRYYCFYRPSFDEPLDGIVYSVMVGMGFATLENAGYIWRHGYEVAFLRMFTSLPAHASFAVVMGYFAGKARFNRQRQGVLLLKGLAASVAVHGTYDAFLLLSENNWLTRYVSDVLLFGGALLSLALAMHLSRRLLRQHHQLSMRLFLLAPQWRVKSVAPADEHLLQLMVQHAVNDAHIEGHHPEHLARLEAWNTRPLQGLGTSFLLVFNADLPIGFIAYHEAAPALLQVQYIYVMLRHRRRGTGRYLMQQLNELATEGGQGALRLHINRNHPDLAFFEKIGFLVQDDAAEAADDEGDFVLQKNDPR